MLSRQEKSPALLGTLPAFGKYYRTKGRDLFLSLNLPQPTDWQSLAGILSEHCYRQLYYRWCQADTTKTPSKPVPEPPADRAALWRNEKMLQRALRRFYRKNPSLVIRLAWLYFVHHPLIPQALANALLGTVLDVRNQPACEKKDEPILDFLPHILVTRPGDVSDSKQYSCYYVPPSVTRLAYQMALSPVTYGQPFPERYQESDGLDAFIQLALLWQLALDSPIQVKLNGSLYKKDSQRLCEKLGTWKCPIPDCEIPHAVWINLACLLGLLRLGPNDLTLQASPRISWQSSSWLDAAYDVWNAWLLYNLIDIYSPAYLAQESSEGEEPHAILQLYVSLAVASVMARLPDDQGISLRQLAEYSQHNEVYSLERGRLVPDAASIVESARNTTLAVMWALGLLHWHGDKKVVRLSPLGRVLLGVSSNWQAPSYTQNMLVMPNLEIIAYRQALTPQDIATLSTIARWQAIAPAAVLHMDNTTVQRALQSGWDVQAILHWLEQHATRELPDTIRSLIITSAEQQQRLTLHQRATLIEFENEHDLEAAIKRGTAGVRVGTRYLLIEDSAPLDYGQFRVTANLDYAKPVTCAVRVLQDGVTLEVKWHHANLLLEAELQQIAERYLSDPVYQLTRYRITPASLSRARQLGWTALRLQEWFLTRCGVRAPDTVTSLFTLPHVELTVQKAYILETGSEALANGLSQWPETSVYIARKLGPTTLAIREDALQQLLEVLKNLGAKVQVDAAASSKCQDELTGS